MICNTPCITGTHTHTEWFALCLCCLPEDVSNRILVHKVYERLQACSRAPVVVHGGHWDVVDPRQVYCGYSCQRGPQRMPSYIKLVPRVLPGIPHAWCREKKEKKKRNMSSQKIKNFGTVFFLLQNNKSKRVCSIHTTWKEYTRRRIYIQSRRK